MLDLSIFPVVTFIDQSLWEERDLCD